MLESECDLLDTFVEDIELVANNGLHLQPINNEVRYTGAIPKNPSPPSMTLTSTKKTDYIPENFKTSVDLINNGICVCVIMRGLPGSGKSFLAEQIIENTVKTSEGHILSADNYFMHRGQYKFIPQKLTEAHEATQKLFTQQASKGVSPLIVDNTNMAYWEMYYYLQVAVQFGYHIEIMEPITPWKFAEGKLAAKNRHSVPIENIKRMKDRYEMGVSLEKILQSLNLDVVREPKMRNIPPLVQESVQEPVRDLIDLEQPAPDGFQWKLYHGAKEESQNEWKTILPKKTDMSSFKSNPPPQKPSTENGFKLPDQEQQVIKEKEKEKPRKNDLQSQKKQRKNNKPKRLSPHRKQCINENPTFAQIRELYPDVKESYLWDFFEKCNGDADWCVNLLCDENLVELMDAGSDLTCNCSNSGLTKVAPSNGKLDDIPKPALLLQNQSPAKQKISKETAKQIDLNEWIITKESIEKKIKIGAEHYPEHVNSVKNWKKPLSEPLISETPIVQSSKASSTSLDADDELQPLTIADELILELDEEYGGGLLKETMAKNHKFPPKIFIKKSTALQLYLEIMEAFYSQEEEARLLTLKSDEELAKQLSEQLEVSKPKSSKKSMMELKTAPSQIGVNIQNNWRDEEQSDDLALKMSKEKLIEMFPTLNSSSLMEIFAGANYNFQETVTFIQDSLNCNQKEREEMAQIQKKVFNTPWEEPLEEGRKNSSEVGHTYTSEHLKTVEDLRQEIKDHQEEQQVCYNKASDAIQKKSYELASYLSNIAKFHKQKVNEARHEVANMMVGIHEKTHSSDTMIDLHYLNLIEASTLLDTFLDRSISRLRAMKKPYEEVHIITGRGLHSANGVPTIKNKTKIRLRERNLTCTDANPGLFRVRIYPQSLLSYEF